MIWKRVFVMDVLGTATQLAQLPVMSLISAVLIIFSRTLLLYHYFVGISY